MSDLGARLEGLWSLERFVLHMPDGSTAEPLGHAPVRRSFYGADGFMSAHLAAQPEAGRPNPVSSLAYCGRWRIEGDIVIHKVEISTRPGMAGGTVRREPAFEGDFLVLTAEVAQDGPWAAARTAGLRWRRIRPETGGRIA